MTRLFALVNLFNLNLFSLVNWLIQRHAEFKLQQETLFLSISLLDRFVQVSCFKMTEQDVNGV